MMDEWGLCYKLCNCVLEESEANDQCDDDLSLKKGRASNLSRDLTINTELTVS